MVIPLDHHPRLASPIVMNLFALAVLTAAIFLTGCSTTPPSTSGDDALLQRFKQADTSGDGSVSRMEFTDFMITEAYALYDKEGKGYVTLEEFTAGGGSVSAFRRMDRDGKGKVTLADVKASEVARGQFVQPFDDADTSGSGHVTYDEFIAYRIAAAPYIR